MSYDPLLDLSNQLCYVHCSFCNTLLLVGAPCNSLLRAELTVICGHCQTLLRVKIGGASFFPLQLVASTHEDSNMNEAVGGRENDNGEKDEITPTRPRVAVNKPPEKRQRAPSAYNQFMREEIKRIKGRYSNITHKEAFSAAAKNWAHIPRNQHKESEVESCSRS